MFRVTLASIATTVAVAATPVAASTVADAYSSFFVFGDSLSDNGNVAAASAAVLPPGVTFPPPPYFDGRFTNGPVWNERFLEDFAPGQSANFAFGGARAVTDAVDDGVPDASAQVAAFAAALPLLTLGDRTLASVFYGANDMFDAVAAAAAAPSPAAAQAAIGARVTATLTSIATNVQALAGLGVDEFVLWNLPDIGATPRLRDLGMLAQGTGSVVTLAYNSAFEGMVATLRGAGLTIHTVDTFGVFTDATTNPAAFGLTNLTDPCIAVDPFSTFGQASAGPACADADARLYWDQLHPTRVGHDAFAAAFDAAVPALPVVPLPAPALLLLAGIGAFAALRRRA
jgi:outer membrane lipase/esterase